MKAEQIARLALARADRRPGVMVVIATDNPRELIRLIRTISHSTVLTVVGDLVRIHHRQWGLTRAASTQAA